MTLIEKPFLETKYIVAAYILFVIVTLAGMFIPLMDNDAGEYAIVAMRMAQTNNFVDIIRKSEDYLDKPHLLFWLSAISMKIFGFTSFAYKLPSVLFAFAALYATTKLGTLLYNRNTGLLAGLVLAFSEAFILSNHDVRTDAILTGATILAIYKFIDYSYNKKYASLIFGSLFLALAVGTKGMVAALVAGMVVLIHMLYYRKVKEFFIWQWLSCLLWFVIFLSPFLYCYYLQFDLHPEKIVKGVQGVSGVKFLLWTQSFERLSGQGNMVDNPDYFFFFHTLLWAFLPWSIITYFSLFKHLSKLVKNRFRLIKGVEVSLSCATLVLLLIFSASKFKLPHYLNILFPLMSIFTAQTIVEAIENDKFRWMSKVFFGISCIYILAVIILNGWAFPVNNFMTITISVLSAITLIYLLTKFKGSQALLFAVVTVGLSNLLLNVNFYQKLLTYQGGITLSKWVLNNKIDLQKINYYLSDRAFSFDYYTHTDVAEKSIQQFQQMSNSKEQFYIISDNKKVEELRSAGIQLNEVKSVDDFHITMLTLPFINPGRRKETLDKLLLFQVN